MAVQNNAERCRGRQPRTVASASSVSSGNRRPTVRSVSGGITPGKTGAKRVADLQAPGIAPESTSKGQQQEDWLAKVLATAGVASRRNCIDLVKQGAVKVNGQVVTDPATKVDPNKDVLAVKGRTIKQPAAVGYHYFAANKPPGYICSNSSDKAPGKRAVDLLQPWLNEWQKQHRGQLPPRLFTVGRLDVATSGLIFLTNDGDWANKVIHPSANIIKEYHVTLPQQPTAQQLQKLRAGTAVEGVHCQPKLVQVLKQPGSSSRDTSRGASRSSTVSSRSSGSHCVVRIDVSEGKKHEVRVLVAAAGLELLALKRVRVGGFVLPRNVPKGGYINLTAKDLERVFQQPRC